MTVDSFQIDVTLIDNREAVDARVASAPKDSQPALSAVLAYLYLLEGPRSITKEQKASAENCLNSVERFVFQWLYKRTDGKLKRLYGEGSVEAVRRCKYQCALCGFADVRALNIEKAECDTTTETQPFTCLCANCNTIAAKTKEKHTLEENKRRAIAREARAQKASIVAANKEAANELDAIRKAESQESNDS